MTDPQPNVVRVPHPAQVPATVALVAGVLICIPGTGLIAIIAGAIAVLRSRKRSLRVPPIALVGLVLGVVQIAWGSAMFVGAYRTYQSAIYAEPAAKASRQFLMFVGSGNLTSAKAMSTDAITLEQLTDSVEQIESWGGLKGDLPERTGWSVKDMDTIRISLPVEFSSANRILQTEWRMIDGAPRLIAYHFEDPAATQPATQPQ